jgi:adenylate cyclase
VIDVASLKTRAEKYLAFGTEGYATETRRRLMVINFMAYLIVLAAVNYAVIFAAFGPVKYAPLILINIFHIFFALAVPFLHRYGENVGAYFIVFFEFASLFIFTAFLGPESGIQINYIIAAAVPFLALERSKLITIGAIIVGGFALHMASRFLAPQMGMMIPSDPLLLANIYFLSAVTTFGLLSAIVYFALLNKDRAEARTNELLRNILPEAIAERLMNEPSANIAEYYPDVTVMFADTVGFTSLASDLGAERTVAMLNDVFTAFDELAEEYDVEKIKTVGDAYMVVSGAPQSVADHRTRIASMALRLREVIPAIAKAHGAPLELRIGIASGPIIGGVIGRRKLVFDVWGDTVNLAARLESHGVSGRIQISSDLAKLLPPRFVVEPREEIELKGFGPVSTAFLVAERPS